MRLSSVPAPAAPMVRPPSRDQSPFPHSPRKFPKSPKSKSHSSMKYSKSPRSQSRQSSRKSSRKFPKSPSHSRHSSRVSRPVSSRQPSRPMSGRHPSRPVSRPASRPASSRLHYPIAFKAMNSKSEYPEEDDPLKDCGDCIPESEGNAWCFLFYGFIASQTSLPALILYMNLFWYLFIMSTIGFRNMTNELWLQSIVLATFLFIVLNAATFESPVCGPNGYFTRYAKLWKLWLIPFGAFSIYMACDSAKGECLMLFPTDLTLLTIQIGMMAFILASGLSIHYIILPKLVLIRKGQSLFLVREIDLDDIDAHMQMEINQVKNVEVDQNSHSTEPVRSSY